MFLVVGESLVDLIGQAGSWRFEGAPGGSPCNVALGLAAAGQPVRLATQVGDDPFGALLRTHLTRHRVDTRDVDTAAATSLAFAVLDASGGASYDFRLSWTWTGQPSLEQVAWLHVGSLAAVVAPGADRLAAVVTAARQQGIPVSYDPNIRPALMRSRDDTIARVEHLVSRADLVKASSDDLAWLYPDLPDLAAAERWRALAPGLVVVTRGAEGAVALPDGYVVECAPPAVALVDTVGAGDAFTAGLLSGLARAGTLATPPATGRFGALAPAALEQALREASATSAAVCARRGAGPAEQGQVARLRDKVTLARRGEAEDARPGQGGDTPGHV